MQQSKSIKGLIVLLVAFTSCVEPYIPKEVISNEDVYVVSGQVTNQGGNHIITISKTSSFVNPKFKPVENCEVIILDSKGKEHSCDTYGQNGKYPVWIDQNDLQPGMAYKLIVITPEGERIESSFDTLKFCPQISDLYYAREDRIISTERPPIKGIKFMIDLNARNSKERYFRWELEETYEHRAQYPIYVYYDGTINRSFPIDYSKYYCWTTARIKSIYTLSTKGLANNQFTGYNLHFVDNTTQRLLYTYSVLVTQYALTEEHFYFWENLRINSSELGGLFDSQPISIKGNLCSTSNPETEVLGFFGASAFSSRRFFFSNIKNLDFEIPDNCMPFDIDGSLEEFSPKDYPIYLIDFEDKFQMAHKFCFDCTLSGGSNQRPTFWPQN